MQGLISQSLEGLWTVSLVAANKRDGEKVFAGKNGFSKLLLLQQKLLKTQRRNYSQKRLGTMGKSKSTPLGKTKLWCKEKARAMGQSKMVMYIIL